MKKLILLLIVVLFSQNSFSQESDLLNDIQKKIYENENVQVRAEFLKGEKKFNEFVVENLKKVFNVNIESEILVSFIVEIDGTISNVEIIKDINNDVRDKIKSTIVNSPKWLPAEHEGYRVKAKVRFNLKL